MNDDTEMSDPALVFVGGDDISRPSLSSQRVEGTHGANALLSENPNLVLSDPTWREQSEDTYRAFIFSGGYDDAVATRNITLGGWLWSLAYADPALEIEIGEKILQPYFSILTTNHVIEGENTNPISKNSTIKAELKEAKAWLNSVIQEREVDQATKDFQDDFSRAVFGLWDTRVNREKTAEHIADA